MRVILSYLLVAVVATFLKYLSFAREVEMENYRADNQAHFWRSNHTHYEDGWDVFCIQEHEDTWADVPMYIRVNP